MTIIGAFVKGTKKLLLDDVLQFGKYKGDTIRDIISRDCQYIAWAGCHIAWFDLDDVAYKLFREKLDNFYESKRNARRHYEEYKLERDLGYKSSDDWPDCHDEFGDNYISANPYTPIDDGVW